PAPAGEGGPGPRSPRIRRATRFRGHTTGAPASGVEDVALDSRGTRAWPTAEDRAAIRQTRPPWPATMDRSTGRAAGIRARRPAPRCEPIGESSAWTLL